MGVFGFKLAPLALSAVLLATSFTPSQAFAQIPVPIKAERVSDVDMVQYRDRRRGDDEWRRRGYHRRGNDAYYNGHRGHYERRRGYREYNGMWFPLAAFATGAIIGGAVSQPQVRYGGSHVEWCSNRYRSYRAYDNSYQPNYGPRRECNSPY
ncbi:BA14K family protein [Rhizobium herbae]|uniref:Lectin-like protein BA14k n=1 Tax=Rhizobium herbae TaxID=508661 RepID=A0ABS4ENM9_9HYPH|nr:BA14K family protein [Rhizobium herbae]MBP1859530.1 hypothetical protein [Rhizobium herbae]